MARLHQAKNILKQFYSDPDGKRQHSLPEKKRQGNLGKKLPKCRIRGRIRHFSPKKMKIGRVT